MKDCPYCGRENSDEAVYCRECGTGLGVLQDGTTKEPLSARRRLARIAKVGIIAITSAAVTAFSLWVPLPPGSSMFAVLMVADFVFAIVAGRYLRRPVLRFIACFAIPVLVPLLAIIAPLAAEPGLHRALTWLELVYLIAVAACGVLPSVLGVFEGYVLQRLSSVK